MHDLLAGADVFLENFRDGQLDKQGLGAEELRKKYPHRAMLNPALKLVETLAKFDNPNLGHGNQTARGLRPSRRMMNLKGLVELISERRFPRVSGAELCSSIRVYLAIRTTSGERVSDADDKPGSTERKDRAEP